MIMKYLKEHNEFINEEQIAQTRGEFWKMLKKDWREYENDPTLHPEDSMSFLDFAGDIGSGRFIYGWKLVSDDYGDYGSGYSAQPDYEKHPDIYAEWEQEIAEEEEQW